MDFQYQDYVITQTGQDLSCSSAIKLQKYENRRSRLVFELEDWLAHEARLYCALLNPETKRYHYEPVLEDISGNHFVLVGTSMTYYPGKHKMILIGVTPSVELDDNITYDLSNAIYVSKEFNKIVVLDNFLSDEAMQVSMPNLDYALDRLVVLHDNVVELSLQTSEDATNCAESVAACQQILEQCQEVLEACQEELEACQSVVSAVQEVGQNVSSLYNQISSRYQTYMDSMRAAYEEYIESIRNEGGG